MSRKIENFGMSSLKNITDKLAQDAVKVNLPTDDLIDHPDNEYLFGYQSNEELIELANAMKKQGFIGAVNVWKLDNNKYMIFDGHRRKKARILNGDNTVPSNIHPYPEKETDRKRILLQMNLLDRRGLIGMHPLYASRIIEYMKNILIEEGFKGNMKEQLAIEFDLRPSTIQRYSMFIKCSDKVISALKIDANPDGWLQLNQASAIASLPVEKQDLVLNILLEIKEDIDGEPIVRESVLEIINIIKVDFKKMNKINTPEDYFKTLSLLNNKTDELDTLIPVIPRILDSFAPGEGVPNDEAKTGTFVPEEEVSNDEAETGTFVPEEEVPDDEAETGTFVPEEEVPDDEAETGTFVPEEEVEETIDIDELGNLSNEYVNVRNLADELKYNIDRYDKKDRDKDKTIKVLTDLIEFLNKNLDKMKK